MMSFRLYSLIILILLTSCKTKTYIYDLEDYSGQFFFYTINQKKTGNYYYPKMNFTYTLKNGKLNGIILLIKENDTIVFGSFKNNKPIGKFINKSYKCELSRNIFFGTIIEKYGYGNGVFNEKSKKNGFWKEYTQEGEYRDGKKNGIWKINQSSDLENYKNVVKEILYKNDSIVKK